MATVVQDIETYGRPNIRLERTTLPFLALIHMPEVYNNYPGFQREKVWPMQFKVELIDSMLRGHPIAPISMHLKKGQTNYEILDGQQRMGTILEFIRDGFRTAGKRVIAPSGDILDPIYPHLFFSQLPTEAAEVLKHYNIPLDIYHDADPRELGLIFRRSQNQVPLTTAEKLFSYNSHAIRFAREVTDAQHPFTGNDHPLYRGKTHRRQEVYMTLVCLWLEAMGGVAATNGTSIESLAKGTKDTFFTQGATERMRGRFDLVRHAFYGASFGTVLDCIVLYQTVLFLDNAGYDLATSPEGVLAAWYATVQEEDRRQRKMGNTSVAQRMRKVSNQQAFWKDQLLLVSQTPQLTTYDAGRSQRLLTTITSWMNKNRVCPFCNELVMARDIEKHGFYLKSDTTGTCRERRA